ncbi:MAG: hypothetical protein M1817_002595 [Caeruleum heppii]|nr:MAG: hypothetical protein M1817_002595 [Caeruleum heppii]
MADWKDRGFVPDSDEEEADDEREADPHPYLRHGFVDIDNRPQPAAEHRTASDDLQRTDKAGVSLDPLGDNVNTNTFVCVEVGNGRSPRPALPPVQSGPLVNGVESDALALEALPSRCEPSTEPVHRQHEDEQGRTTIWNSSTVSVLDMCSSSPLTELMSTPPSVDFTMNEGFEHRGKSPLLHLSNSRSSMSAKEGIMEVPPGQRQWSPDAIYGGSYSRSFRKRNPIQLHPYLLESERYRQSLKARGLKPVRVPSDHDQHAEEPTNRSSQEQSFEVDNDSQRQEGLQELWELPPSPPVSGAGRRGLHHHALLPDRQTSPTLQIPNDELDELPDFETLLRQPRLERSRSDVKRRKVSHIYSHNKNRRLLSDTGMTPPGLPTPSTATQDVQTAPAASANLREPSSSPPRSAISRPTSGLRQSSVRFRYPRGFSPLEAKRQQPSPISLQAWSRDELHSSDTESEPMRQASGKVRATSVSSPSASGSESDPTDQVSRVRRKIKGVLPASWLKLDEQKTSTPILAPLRKDGHLTNTELQPRAGVARRKPPSYPRGRSTPIENASSEAEDESAPTTAEPVQAELIQVQWNKPLWRSPETAVRDLTDIFSDIEEDNEIDAMLSSKPRTKAQSKLGTNICKLDSRKGPGDIRRSRPATLTPPPDPRRRQARITDHVFKSSRRHSQTKKTPKRAYVQMSIVDADDSAADQEAPAPQFIRVAKRLAKARRNMGRHSPRRKLFRLARREDTAEVQNVLHDWRTRLAAENQSPEPQQSPPSSHRTPLVELEQNANRTHRPLQGNVTSGFGRESPIPHSWKSANISGVISRQPQISKLASAAPLLDRSSEDATRRKHAPLRIEKPRRDYLFPQSAAVSGPRPAQVESVTSRYPANKRLVQPSRNAAVLKEALNSKNQHLGSRKNDSLLDSVAWTAGEASRLPEAARDNEQTTNVSGRKAVRPAERARKRAPHRLDANATEFRQPVEALLVHENHQTSPRADGETVPALRGLAPFGASYSIDFDTIPLHMGTFFHESTFVGSGELSKCISFTSRRYLDEHAGSMSVQVGNRYHRWDCWNDTVASELELAFDELVEKIEAVRGMSATREAEMNEPSIWANAESTFRPILKYVSKHLSFSDPIDRTSFANKACGLLRNLLEGFPDDLVGANPDPKGSYSRNSITTLMYALVLAHQVSQVTQHETCSPILQDEAKEVKLTIGRCLIRALCPWDPQPLRVFYEQNQRHSNVEQGIRENEFLPAAWVVAWHVFGQDDNSGSSFWSVINVVLASGMPNLVTDVQVLESMWFSMITLLPLQEIDEQGVLDVNRRFRKRHDNWAVPKMLIGRFFALYKSQHNRQLPSLNVYSRALFSRCHYLIRSWGWHHCDSIIGTLFDFFAANNLAHLPHEESRGSAKFLEALDEHQDLDLEPGDRCFHILLKIVGTGIAAMVPLYPEKKIRQIVFRLMPNHGRQYPREESVRQEDLDSLRNHHDLLSVLYWASPASSRPSINVLRDLVDARTSHREACHISIRAWRNLVRFQLSTNEPTALLEPFCEWHDGITSQLLKQHTSAEAESRAQFALVGREDEMGISPELLESTVSKNQRQVEAILIDALSSVKTTLSLSKDAGAARVLLRRASTADIFRLFDARKARPNKVVMTALEVVDAYLRCCKTAEDASRADGNEDSQDYGDWTVFEEGVALDNSLDSYQHLRDMTHDALAQLVSDAFGADSQPEDRFLVKLLETWASVAAALVHKGIKHWNEYFDAYSKVSWTSLRRTGQTRRYASFFLSSVLQKDNSCYESNKPYVLSCWAQSLVERESMLRHQHRLTTAVLNADASNLLFRNLPFWIKKGDTALCITEIEFSERRLSLISSVLSNMRAALEDDNPIDVRSLRHEYAQLLRAVMSAMKSNYQELQQQQSTSGAYVNFVHRVVGLLQEHTIEICPIDRFFTDSTAFPLPATDPTYVVGRLKNYGLRLAEARVHKQVVYFVQSVSERAAVDGLQGYLVEQLRAAMCDTSEASSEEKPTLRRFLAQGVFPAYIELALSTPTGWILADPILRAITAMFGEMLQDLNVTDDESVAAVTEIVTTVLQSIRDTVELLVDHSGLLEQASTLHSLALMLDCITSTLVPTNYICLISRTASSATDCINFFSAFATFIQQVLHDSEDITSPHEHQSEHPAPSTRAFSDIRSFATHELRTSLTNNWVRRGEEYYLLRGSVRKAVNVQGRIGTVEEERDRVLRAIERFEETRGVMRGLGGGEWGRGRRRRRGRGVVCEVVF